jgi:hypothetical protein
MTKNPSFMELLNRPEAEAAMEAAYQYCLSLRRRASLDFYNPLLKSPLSSPLSSSSQQSPQRASP